MIINLIGYISPLVGHARIGTGLEVRWGRVHTGYDLNYSDARDNDRRSGTLVAPVSGVIEIEYDQHADYNRGRPWQQRRGYGNQIFIRETQDPNDVGSAPRRWRLAHLDHFAAGLQDGMFVEQGQLIGVIGNTGKSSNPHLHMEIQPRIPGTTTFSPQRLRLRDVYERDDFNGNMRTLYADISSPIDPDSARRSASLRIELTDDIRGIFSAPEVATSRVNDSGSGPVPYLSLPGVQQTPVMYHPENIPDGSHVTPSSRRVETGTPPIQTGRSPT